MFSIEFRCSGFLVCCGQFEVSWLSMFFFPKRCTESTIFRTVEPFRDVVADSVVVVDSREIIPPRFLPTFSSRAFELYLHRIPRLSETFVYFNDDVALLKTYEPGGLVSRLLYSQERVLMPSGTRAENESVWGGSLKHMDRVLDKRYGNPKKNVYLWPTNLTCFAKASGAY